MVGRAGGWVVGVVAFACQPAHTAQKAKASASVSSNREGMPRSSNLREGEERCKVELVMNNGTGTKKWVWSAVAAGRHATWPEHIPLMRLWWQHIAAARSSPHSMQPALHARRAQHAPPAAACQALCYGK